MEKPDKPAATSRPHGAYPIRTALTQPRILHRWIEAQLGPWTSCDGHRVHCADEISKAHVLVPFAENSQSARKPQATIVIVTHQSANLVESCLDSVRDFSARLIREIVIVDSGSSDGTLAVLRGYAKSSKDFPIRVIDAHGNIGFAPAVNLALRSIDNTQVLLLNPDARFRNDVLALLQSVSDSTVGCLSLIHI